MDVDSDTIPYNPNNNNDPNKSGHMHSNMIIKRILNSSVSMNSKLNKILALHNKKNCYMARAKNPYRHRFVEKLY